VSARRICPFPSDPTLDPSEERQIKRRVFAVTPRSVEDRLREAASRPEDKD
jgi:hypothetical protein